MIEVCTLLRNVRRLARCLCNKLFPQFSHIFINDEILFELLVVFPNRRTMRDRNRKFF